MRDDPELTHAAIHALNEWMYEEWTFNYEDRIFATPVITLPIVEKAIEELEWVLDAGRQDGPDPPGPRARATAARARSATPSSTRSGRAVEEADILVSMHSSDSGYTRYRTTGPARRTRCCPSGSTPSASSACGKRPMEDTMTAFLCHGVFARFPELRVASIESGGDWVAGFLDHVGDTYKKMPQAFEEDPVEQFKAHVCDQPVPRGRPRARSSTRSGRTTSSSVPTIRTPRGWPSRAVTSTTCRPGCPTRICARSWAATWPGS